MRCVCLLICVCTCAACFFPERNLPKELSETVSMGSCEAQVFISLNDLPHGETSWKDNSFEGSFLNFGHSLPLLFLFFIYLLWGLRPGRAEIPWAGIKPEPQLQPEPQRGQCLIPHRLPHRGGPVLKRERWGGDGRQASSCACALGPFPPHLEPHQLRVPQQSANKQGTFVPRQGRCRPFLRCSRLR